MLDPTIFKAYDIRGIVDKGLTLDAARQIGLVFGTEARRKGIDAVCVGRDGRLSGPRLVEALCEGLSRAGVDVYDLGMVPTPVVYFASVFFETGTSIAVTGSHNPPEYNGFKMMMAGATLSGDAIQDLRRRIEEKDWVEAETPGRIESRDALTPYVERIVGQIRPKRALRVALDAGNGVAGPTALRLFDALGFAVEPLFCDVDGNFPNHHPDPSKPENLEALKRAVTTGEAEIGLAFDGDGDRLGVVTKSGEVIYPDRLAMLYARDILSRHAGGTIIYDVKCTRLLAPFVRECGGEPVICRTGHSFVKAEMKARKALFAAEMSGHLFFNDERWMGFDDGVYAAVRLCEILSGVENPTATLEALPGAFNTPELQIRMKEGEPHAFVKLACERLPFEDAREVIKVDGLRVEWEDGFALVRASNTTPVLVLRFEGDSPEALSRIRERFVSALRSVKPDLAEPR